MTKNKKTQQLKSPMTLDKLALMMGKGFNEVHEKFNEVHEKIDTLKQDVDTLKEDVGILKEDVGVLKEGINTLKEQHNEMLNTQDKILKDVEDLKDENIMDMAFRGRVENRFVCLEHEIRVIKEKIKI